MWSFTGISSDGYNALYVQAPFALQASAALWGLLLGVDRADLRLWQGHSRTSARLCPLRSRTGRFRVCTLGTVGPGRWGGTSAHDVLRWLPPQQTACSISAETTRASLNARQSGAR